MSSERRARCLVLAAMGLGCTAPAAVDRCPEAAASAPIVAPATIASAALPPARDPAERALEDSAIVALTPAAGLGPSAGVFTATLSDTAGSATLTLALASAPTAYRRPLAYARLAAALGMHVVPAAVERHLGAGEIAALLAPQPEFAALLAPQLRVLNDGTVTALLSAPVPGSPGKLASVDRIAARDSFEVRTWARWAASPAPAANEHPRLTRDFVEMLALDYLAANGTRRSLLLDRDRDALVLDDNREAFPRSASPLAVDRLLRRLRSVARFPRGLRAALVAFDPESARRILTPGAFEGWLVSPRALIELDERRAGLLSLIEARIAERGEAAVLAL
jgi:hypothetical protein